VVSLLLVLPYLLFSPTAGWMADRFSKSLVIQIAAWSQWLVVILLLGAVLLRSLELSLVCFLLYSLQCCLLSPSKLGIVKDMVGSRRLAFATGIVEGLVIMAILSGQILGGLWFDKNQQQHANGWVSAQEALYWIVGIALLGALAAQAVKRSPALHGTPFSARLMFSHIRDSRVVWADRKLRLCALGTAYFWGFAGFVNLVVIAIAKQSNPAELGTAISEMMLFATLGIAGGSIAAGLLSKRGIQWSLVPLGLLLMSSGLFSLSLQPLSSGLIPWLLCFSGAGAAIFLVPVNAFVQDHPPAEIRGTVIAVSNFFNNVGGISAVLIQLGMSLCGMSVQMQFFLIGFLSLGFAILAIKEWTVEFLRALVLPLVRLIYRIRVIGGERIPEQGGILLLPNHVTWADSFFISAACRRPVRFVMFDGFTKVPAIGFFSRIFEVVPISATRAKDAVRTVADALEQGSVVCLFPEGELTRTGCLEEVKRGLELMARKAGKPCVPLWMDGAWGSIFSFERGRFFTKLPYAVPYGMTFAFGKPQEAQEATTHSVRCALQAASALALRERCARRGWLQREDAAAWCNGFQIGQVLALPRGGDFVMWHGDPMSERLGGMRRFADIFGGKIASTEAAVATQAVRVGGKATRELLERTLDITAGVFYDFEPQQGWQREGLVYCPCWEMNGVVIAMSMPNPPQQAATILEQHGSRAGSVGRLLPGIEVTEDGATFFGPTFAGGCCDVPAGTRFDERSFVFLAE
jgi:acyl-[acyl-carrier-protein]-phospholipid O-acyltransferase/long-chain-fatty-acid--[acyl-carrier-protein] ligase